MADGPLSRSAIKRGGGNWLKSRGSPEPPTPPTQTLIRSTEVRHHCDALSITTATTAFVLGAAPASPVITASLEPLHRRPMASSSTTKPNAVAAQTTMIDSASAVFEFSVNYDQAKQPGHRQGVYSDAISTGGRMWRIGYYASNMTEHICLTIRRSRGGMDEILSGDHSRSTFGDPKTNTHAYACSDPADHGWASHADAAAAAASVHACTREAESEVCQSCQADRRQNLSSPESRWRHCRMTSVRDDDGRTTMIDSASAVFEINYNADKVLDKLCLTLQLLSKRASSVKAVFEVLLIDKDGIPAVVAEIKTWQLGTVECIHTSGVLSLTDLVKKYVKDGQIKFLCTITTILNDDSSIVPARTSGTGIRVPTSDLIRHLGTLLDTADGTDLAFTIDGETFNAHRAILAARSPVFRAELLGSMAEATMTSITLHDIAPATASVNRTLGALWPLSQSNRGKFVSLIAQSISGTQGPPQRLHGFTPEPEASRIAVAAEAAASAHAAGKPVATTDEERCNLYRRYVKEVWHSVYRHEASRHHQAAGTEPSSGPAAQAQPPPVTVVVSRSGRKRARAPAAPGE
ncbi:hypothetical protein HU200_061867 [Digitaria exilis]|uniref:BTB domain-containing protein n=1 Tax=Digitaria exilis TaxID=1010633 RepID=A0A835DW34_9POAL|nr:hypothetical protein HU200_061867 [Digitaria exilis]